MARTRTLAQLREEVRQRVDVENATTWLPNAELTRYINQSIARLHRLIAREHEELLVDSQTVVTVPGVELYTLLAGYHKIVGSPEVDLGGPGPVPMRRWTWAERTSYLYTGGWTSDQPVAYRILGADQLSFLPVPNAAHTITIHYIPPPTDLAADGDTYDGRAGWEEWIVVDAAIKVAIKEESDTTELRAERDELWRDITADLATVDQGAPPRVGDVRGDGADWGYE